LVLWDEQSSTLTHFYRNNAPNDLQRRKTKIVATSVISPATIIQSNYGQVEFPGNFEVVFKESIENDIFHYWRDNSNSDQPWNKGPIIFVYK
jgi:hypothetical protein